MNNIVSYGGTDFRTEGDFALINQLLKNPRYVIPEHLRHKVVKCIEQTIDSSETKPEIKLKAVQTLAILDKHNIDLVKVAMPKRVEQTTVRQMTDEKILEMVKEITKKLPTVIQASDGS